MEFMIMMAEFTKGQNHKAEKLERKILKNLLNRTQKAEFYFGLSKIRSKIILSHSQIAQLLSKREYMVKKCV